MSAWFQDDSRPTRKTRGSPLTACPASSGADSQVRWLMPPPSSVTRCSKRSGLALSSERTRNNTVCPSVHPAGVLRQGERMGAREQAGAEGRHVPFPGEPFVGLLDVGLAGAPADSQDAVRVEIPRRRRGLRSQGRQQQGGGPGQARPPQLHGSGGRRLGGAGGRRTDTGAEGTGDRRPARAADGPPSPTLRRRFRRARPAVTIETGAASGHRGEPARAAAPPWRRRSGGPCGAGGRGWWRSCGWRLSGTRWRTAASSPGPWSRSCRWARERAPRPLGPGDGPGGGPPVPSPRRRA